MCRAPMYGNAAPRFSSPNLLYKYVQDTSGISSYLRPILLMSHPTYDRSISVSRQPEPIRRDLRLFLCYNVITKLCWNPDTAVSAREDCVLGSLSGNVTARVCAKRFVFRRIIRHTLHASAVSIGCWASFMWSRRPTVYVVSKKRRCPSPSFQRLHGECM